MEKFEMRGATLVVHEPLTLEDEEEEDKFLDGVERMLEQKGNRACLDLRHAGNLSSTLIALIIAAVRKAENAKKQLRVITSSRNRLAVKISGLDKLVEVEFL